MQEAELRQDIQRDIQRLRKRLERFREEHLTADADLEPGRLRELPNILDPFLHGLNRLEEVVELLVEQPSSEAAMNGLTTMTVLAAQPDAVGSRLEMEATTEGVAGGVMAKAKSHWSQMVSSIKSVIQSISASLWSLLSGHLNLKEWSVKGSVSTPAITSFLGISGSAELQLTFEK